MDNNSFLKRLSGKTKNVDEESDYNKIDLGKLPSTDHLAPDMDVPDPEGPVGQLTVDIYHTPNEIVIQSAIAGARPEDIDVSVTPEAISIKGLRRRETTVPDAEYLYQECYWGRFARSIILPEEVDPEHANVHFRNGILSVKLPKTNRGKARRLEVRMD